MLKIVYEHKAVRLGLGQSGAGTGVGGGGVEGRKEEKEDLLHYLLDLYLQYDDKSKSSKGKSNGANGSAATNDKTNGNTSDDSEDKTGETSGGGTGGGDGGKSTYIAPTDDNLRDVLINMFLAGRDTTASAINWCIYRCVIYRNVYYVVCIVNNI